MNIGFFDIVFECNKHRFCYGYERRQCLVSDVCGEFNCCFNTIPSVIWSDIKGFDDLYSKIEKWRVYNE